MGECKGEGKGDSAVEGACEGASEGSSKGSGAVRASTSVGVEVKMGFVSRRAEVAVVAGVEV